MCTGQRCRRTRVEGARLTGTTVGDGSGSDETSVVSVICVEGARLTGTTVGDGSGSDEALVVSVICCEC